MKFLFKIAKASFKDSMAKHSPVLPYFSFCAGFVLDILMLGRIDSWSGILQHVVGISVVGVFLVLELRHSLVPFQAPRMLSRPWDAREPILHFFLGGVLSSFTLFYFLSASIFQSLLFMLLLAGLLVANETARFKKLGLSLRFAVFSLCVYSFFAYFIPIVVGTVGAFTFLLSVLLGLGLLHNLGRILCKALPDHRAAVQSQLIRPSLAMAISFLVLYFLKWIPPVPLSAQYIGIYHGLKKKEGRYELTYNRPKWKFWQNGDQTFYAKDGDQIYAFARIFAPNRFKDKIYFHWLRINQKNDWETWDRIPMILLGGRNEGFRGYVYKKNWDVGKWQVRLETEAGREIGRLYFDVLSEDREAPEVQVDVF